MFVPQNEVKEFRIFLRHSQCYLIPKCATTTKRRKKEKNEKERKINRTENNYLLTTIHSMSNVYLHSQDYLISKFGTKTKQKQKKQKKRRRKRTEQKKTIFYYNSPDIQSILFSRIVI